MFRCREQIRVDLESCSNDLINIELTAYGSSASGLGFRTSDVDFSLRTSRLVNKHVSVKKTLNYELKLANFFFKDHIQLLKDVSKVLNIQMFGNIEVIASAKVKVLKCRHRPSSNKNLHSKSHTTSCTQV